MGNSFRIKATPGRDQNLIVQVDQDFEQLEILSLKLRQTDVYPRSCSDKGIIAGRVFANNGYGIPNAKISVFIPVTDSDSENPNISTIYPYKSLEQVNEDGFQYNLLPYYPSYPGHTPTGTFPSRTDVLTNQTAMQLYDEYYKFAVQTNDSGDYMIYGVPVGTHTIVMNVDLSDIGTFSCGPQDLVRMGLATEEQMDGDKFKASANFKQLPQIVVINKTIEVSPFWGEEEVCQIGITRTDFDLTNEANINLQPAAVFMGSMMSSSERTALKPTGRARKITGQLCRMIAGPGEIIALRQTINQDSAGLPIIERASLPNGGRCIDGDGTWLIDVPMNLDYVYTDEFGNQVLSNDPTVGVPTKAKYRFKIKWQQSKSLSEDYKRAYWIVPNIREKGWDSNNPVTDPVNLPTNSTQYKKFQSSYAFSFDWSAYTWDTANVSLTNTDILDAINCVDTFYEFDYNKVYTVSMFMDNYRLSNNRQRFLAIKRIDDDSCDDTVNRYPVNDAYFNAGVLWRILNILIIILSYIMFPLLFVYHVLAFVWNVVVRNLWYLLGLGLLTKPLKEMKGFSLPMITYPDCDACDCGVNVGYTRPVSVSATINNLLGTCNCYKYNWSVNGTVSLNNSVNGYVIYTDCSGQTKTSYINSTLLSSGNLPCSTKIPIFRSYASSAFSTITITKGSCCDQPSTIQGCIPSNSEEEILSQMKNFHDPNVFSENNVFSPPSANERNILAGFGTQNSTFFGLPLSSQTNPAWYSEDIPFAERINLFNTKSKYYSGDNVVEVCYEPTLNAAVKHYDNVLVFILKKQTTNNFTAGTMFTFVSTESSNDPNVDNGPSNSLNTNNVSGTTVYPTTLNISYADFSNRNANISVQYTLPQFNDSCGSSLYIHRSDIEYFQVITGLTISEYMNSNLGGFIGGFGGLRQVIQEDITIHSSFGAGSSFTNTPWEYIDQDSVILICQRGVDPYSPFYTTRIGLGRLFGKANYLDFQVTVPLRLNIPIQNATDSRTTVCFKHNTAVDNNTPQYGLNLFYPSYCFTPDPTQYQSYSTDKLNFYSELDWYSNYRITPTTPNINGAVSITTNPPTVPPEPLGLEVWSLNNNVFYTNGPGGVKKYHDYESIVGGSYMFWDDVNNTALYFSKIYDSSVTIQMSNSRNIIVRSDRLPSGDNFITTAGITRTLLLQQNNEIKLYLQIPIFDSISNITGGVVSNPNSVLPPDNQDDQSTYSNILDSFDCAGMKQIGCYKPGTGFQILLDPSCTPNSDNNHVVNGCYTFMVKYKFSDIFSGRGPILDFFKYDIANYFEYFYRLRLNFALCQDVFGTMFHNNWVNGNLYSFPIRINTYYNSSNVVSQRKFPKDVVVLHDDTNSFYYRSSPYDDTSQKFIGKFNSPRYKGANERNIKYPTTIMNLGPKYSFLKYIILSKQFEGYNIDKIDFTSYKDLEDIINLFVLTRMLNPTFLTLAFGGGQGSITNFYSRPAYNQSLKFYIDGDAAQAMAINSQLGVISFDESFYTSAGASPSIIVQLAGSNTVMGIFFQSSDEDMQTRDYVSPMRTIVGVNFAGVWKYESIPHNSQFVPNYKWNIQPGSTIFGTQLNDWDYSQTNGEFYVQKYQDMDRLNDPYLTKVPSPSTLQIGYRGYLTSNVNDFNNPITLNPGLVGAPWYFYFGLMKGNTALNKFYTKYVGSADINE